MNRVITRSYKFLPQIERYIVNKDNWKYIGPTNEDLYLDTPEFTMPKHGKTVCGSSVGSPYG